MIKIFIYLIIIISSFFVGYLLAKICKEELESFRKIFFYIYITTFPIILFFSFLKIEKNLKLSIILSLVFIMIVSFMSFWLSYDKKFIKN